MNQFFCMFFPPIVAVAMLRLLQKKRLDWQYALFAYGGFTCIINLLIYLVQVLLLGGSRNFQQNSTFNNSYMVQYLIAALAFAIVLPFLFEVVRRSVHLRLEIRPAQKDEHSTGEDDGQA